MSRKTLVIFPSDDTTIFLEKIISYINTKIDPSLFTLFRIECSDESHINAINEISKTNYSTVIFLGHGSSTHLHGARCNDYQKESFLSIKQLQVFSDRNIFLLACDSTTLLKKSKHEFNLGIGFGSLPTDMGEVIAARETDANAYPDVNKDTIDLFCNTLVDIVRFSIVDFLLYKLPMKDLRNLILLRINRSIASNFKSKVSNHIALNDFLLQMKTELVLI